MRTAAAAIAMLGVAVAACAAAEDDLTGSELPGQVVVAPRMGGPAISETGVADYQFDAQGIEDLPAGTQTPISDVLAQMPGVAIDQNQQIHIRSTEGPGFQYQINGFLVPLDINTNPPFLSMLNASFIERLDLKLGALPSRYGFATGGVVDIQTRDGCRAPGGELSLFGGQRSTFSPDIEVARCDGNLSTYLSGRQTWSNTAFSSATPGPTPVHDSGRQTQALGFWSYAMTRDTHVEWLLSATRSDNQLPNAPGLAPAYSLAGVAQAPSSADVDSRLDFRDYLLMADIKSSPAPGLDVQLGLSAHVIRQQFDPDPVGELIYQGVASRAIHEDHDNALQADLRYESAAHSIGAGFYVGVYDVRNNDDSLAFAADATGAQTSNAPLRVLTGNSATNVVGSFYISDLWRAGPAWSIDAGLRADDLTGYTHAQALSPRLNVTWRPAETTSWHLGAGRFMQVPSFLGIAPTTQAAFAGTTAAGSPGAPLPVAEFDTEVDAGVVVQATAQLTLSLDNYFERTRHYLDTGQFGVVPIFAPFNYGDGHIWGTEFAARYQQGRLAAYANITAGKNWQRGVATGQFNFSAEELQFIDAHSILLDHQPAVGVSAGVSYSDRGYAYSADAIYSSGLAGGFADTQTLPQVLQFNASLQRSFAPAGRPPVDLRISVLNLLDRINEIRSVHGIGIFQAAYAPRRTVYGTITLHF
ncbi:MAG: TonB-dependent receptor [Steroidobacterales bacterium]